MRLILAFILLVGFCMPVQAQTFSGIASWYGKKFHGRKTASGQIYDMNRMTAAHKTLPFGTKLKVTNIRNGRSVIVTLTDRGPFIKKRVLDLSKAAAQKLNITGTAKVCCEVIK